MESDLSLGVLGIEVDGEGVRVTRKALFTFLNDTRLVEFKDGVSLT